MVKRTGRKTSRVFVRLQEKQFVDLLKDHLNLLKENLLLKKN